MTEDAGFGKTRRLREAREFNAVFEQRRVLRGECFHLHYRPNGGDSARLGLVIAKKLAKRSVWRNAIKRVGREAFRLMRSRLPATDLIVRLAKPVGAVDDAAKRQWRAEIDGLLARLPR
ncbi:MAG: ribonuclease P protein component [Thauera sp.]|nr:ribonuclease P protein component [Thauera sp.]